MIKRNPTTPQDEFYCRFGACGMVFPETDWAGAQSPCCGAVGVSRENWPPPAVLALLGTVSQQDLDSAAGLQTAAVVLCFAVEMTVENILIGLMKTASETEKTPDLESGRRIEKLISAYEKISGSTMAELFESLGEGNFMADIRQLSKLRDKLVREKDYPTSQAEKRAVLLVRDRCVKYFALLNNGLYSRTVVKKPGNTDLQRKKSVLVVDDELFVLNFVCKLVKRQGLNVFGASTGTEGIRLFRENGPDCVLLDIALPDIDGLSVLKEMKEINPSAVVHMVTGIGGEAIERQAKKLGTSSYISKPINPDALINIIKNI